MSATLLEGAPIADKIKEDVKAAIASMSAPPKLCAVLATDNKGAAFYAAAQQKACEEVGIGYELVELGAEADQSAIETKIAELNADSAVTGIILLMPVAEGVDARACQAAIDPKKDVDGVHPANLGRVVQGGTTLAPCTAQAAFALAQASGVPLFSNPSEAAGKGVEVCVVGHSEIVGKPTALLLLDRFCTVTVCHIGTQDLKAHTTKADLLVVAVGKAGLITGEHIKPGAVVIDVGINRIKGEDGKMKTVGDVVFEEAVEIASQITPVPGGVGTVTTAMLLKNVVDAARLQGM
ncbi:MAG: bifunctional 5,10-methylenetetrahydrofolate dehydrogenase/5,10-methenyltetrahydrofolate cyclohydrolase [Armatimonadetes bacterium]|nr:bifunctional 5,10-methylenetetrahydrofolate dehydrogenase/5,10-methenyltetrahydrofolate cyclohydrolase [Armatimonadota bacterium]